MRVSLICNGVPLSLLSPNEPNRKNVCTRGPKFFDNLIDPLRSDVPAFVSTIPRCSGGTRMYPAVRNAWSCNPTPKSPHALPASNETASVDSFPPEASKSKKLAGSVRVLILITPPSAPLPYRSDVAPLKTSALSMLTRGKRFQYTQPPNGLFKGTPSYITSARLAPFAPTPRSDTPCDVGLAVRPPERRNNENPGAWRNTSSIVNAPDNAISRLPSAYSLVGVAGIRSSPAVTTMRSIIVAASSRTCSGSLDPGPSSLIFTGLKPAAFT